MKYEVMSFIGDYAVEKQPCWNIKYPNLKAAIKAAKGQHRAMSPEHDGLYTIVMKEHNSYNVFWLIYNDYIIKDPVEATKLADTLANTRNKL